MIPGFPGAGAQLGIGHGTGDGTGDPRGDPDLLGVPVPAGVPIQDPWHLGGREETELSLPVRDGVVERRVCLGLILLMEIPREEDFLKVT